MTVKQEKEGQKGFFWVGGGGGGVLSLIYSSLKYSKMK